ncbi:hypothetical protein DL546_000067 [Coniochaeta pulveracea]|uniref:WSC domain-containing protein n=1 Tax=Coniochaeta pulveracea TaxID=177199 RepID=A0A420Y0A0_9PEZI|nr:hypothetical protein DL546_000067 [Coniochaeta pulveracea]
MSMLSRSHWLTGLTAVASLAGVVHGQAFYGTDQSTACAAFPDFANLGCYLGDIRAASGYEFSPMNYNPSNPSNTYPGFWPGNDFNNTVTPSACARACRGFGFRVAALYDGDCSCGYNDPTGLTLLATCAAPCSGDASQTCGGGGATQVFVDPSFADPDAVAGTPQTQLAAYYQRLGCFHIIGGQEFPTQNRVNSAFTSSTVQVCLESCALLRYPLAYASYIDVSSVHCECGETFAAGVFRVDESTDTTGMCRTTCADGTPGTCDPTTGLCCGTGDFASVYINPELEGCYTPPIPGFGQVGAVNPGPLACASVAASLTGGPRTLTRTVYPAATLNPYTPQPSHPLTVVGSINPNTYHEYGCVAQPILSVAVGSGGTPSYTTANILATSMSLEACADACIGSLYFAVTDGE